MDEPFTGKALAALHASGDHTYKSLAKLAKITRSAVAGRIDRYLKSNPRPEGVTTSTGQRAYPPVRLRAAVFDIECMNFKAVGETNFLICTSILPLDRDEVETLSIRYDEKNKDIRLLKDVITALEKYDILIGHNIASFDMNWLHSRLMYHGLPTPQKRWLYYDTYQRAKTMAIKAERKSLGHLIDFFDLKGIKTAVLPRAWRNVASRTRKEHDHALQEIALHCEYDVYANREVFHAMYPHDRGMRNLPVVRKW